MVKTASKVRLIVTNSLINGGDDDGKVGGLYTVRVTVHEYGYGPGSFT